MILENGMEVLLQQGMAKWKLITPDAFWRQFSKV